jgi:hypothetical protein
MKMIAFYASEDWMNVAVGATVKVQFSLTKNEWRNVVQIEGAITRLKQI